MVYCKKDCQRSDWKANHKTRCITNADRVPQPRAPLADCKEAAFEGEDGPICLDPVVLASATTLPCAHVFHAACVAELQKFKLKQACPLCRTPLPPGPGKLHEDATLRYLVVDRRVERGKASWGALTKDEQREMHAAVGGWRAVCSARGLAQAQCNLGNMFGRGRSVAQSDVEAARWYRKAADQGYALAQYNLGVTSTHAPRCLFLQARTEVLPRLKQLTIRWGVSVSGAARSSPWLGTADDHAFVGAIPLGCQTARWSKTLCLVCSEPRQWRTRLGAVSSRWALAAAAQSAAATADDDDAAVEDEDDAADGSSEAGSEMDDLAETAGNPWGRESPCFTSNCAARVALRGLRCAGCFFLWP
jgi:TPR repeat protein